ncbi:Ketosteroid isomerase YybH [Bacillus subtilis]|nr:Ketosteroid isomerase YybH [Bacillus subtilis]
MEQQIKDIISACDLAIQNEDFDTLMNYYTEDAVLVVKPGMIARGKKKSKKRLWQLRTISIIILSRHKGK